MKRSVFSAAVLVILLIGCGSDVHAELTPEQTKEAESLTQQFSAREFARLHEQSQYPIGGTGIILLLRRRAEQCECDCLS